MTVQLLLVRHGNTFGPGDRIVWVGAGEDLPLVDSGRAQAEALRAALERTAWTPDAAVTGGLVRQIEHLSIALPNGPEASVDPALSEVDYGAWGGLTTDEIVERFGADEVTAWNERSVWPTGADWPETEAQVRARTRGFADAVAGGGLGERVLACSSNGVLRWFLELVPGGLEAARARGDFKVGTGKLCLFEHDGATWSVRFWNRAPADVVALD